VKLSEAKRRVQVGTVLHAVGHYNPNASGTRTVTKVQGNGFWYLCGIDSRERLRVPLRLRGLRPAGGSVRGDAGSIRQLRGR
jgi:hypothetical protein